MSKIKRKCSGCKAWKLDGKCEFGYKQTYDLRNGVTPAEPCPKPKYVFEYNRLKDERINQATTT